MAKYGVKDVVALVRKMENSLLLIWGLGARKGSKKTPPSFQIDYSGSDEFYNPADNSITIGLEGVYEIFKPKDDEDTLMALEFVVGHEEQHFRSTASTPYAWGIRQGLKAIVEYVWMKEVGTKRFFRSEKEVIECANELGDKHHIYMNMSLIMDMISMIQNSLEDGRIERIRSYQVPKFSSLRTLWRWRNWKRDICNIKKEEISAQNKLILLTNNILSLATTYKYEQGFYAEFCNEPEIMDYMDKFIPHIQRAVIAETTRAMAVESIEIAKILAPAIYEAAKLPEGLIEALKEMKKIQQKSVGKGMLVNGTFDGSENAKGLSEQDECTESGMDDSIKGSDLFPEKEKEASSNQKETSKNETENSSDKKDNANSKEDSSDKNSEDNGSDENSENSSSNNSDEDADSDGDSGNNNSDDSSSSDSTEEDSSTKEDNSSKDNSGKEEVGSKKEDSESEKTKDGDRKSSLAEDLSAEDKKKSEKELEKEMEEAAKKVHSEYSFFIESTEQSIMNETTAAKKKIRNEKQPKPEEPVDEAAMSELIGYDFVELKRKYPVSKPLPPLIASQGKTLHRQNVKFFKSLSIPDIRYLDKGSIDPSRVYGLACGDYDIYKRNGSPHKNEFTAYILIDNSGSMSGTKRKNACLGAAVIEEGFKGLMPFKIVAFDSSYTINHEVIKDWNENFKNNCCYNFLTQGRDGGGNDDQCDILIATDELMKRPEPKKLLVYMSDGTPSGVDQTKNAIIAARKKGIQVCGIYFEQNMRDSKQFEYILQKDYICCTPSEIMKNLQIVFKRFSHS